MERLLELTQEQRGGVGEFLSWLRSEFGVESPGQKLEQFATLDTDAFLTEVRRRRPRGSAVLTPREVTALRTTHADYAGRVLTVSAEIEELETRLSGLVNEAYGLTPAEVQLLWDTAPPRMPRVRRPAPLAEA